MMKKILLALDMSNLSSGGSISILLRYMRYWAESGNVDMTVYYSRPIIREEIERNRLDVRMVEVCRGYPSWKTFLFRSFRLGRLFEHDEVDLVYCVNSMLLRCSVPQVVHMRNLQHFIEPSYRCRFREGGIYEVMRDWICRYSVSHANCCVYVSNYLRGMAKPWQKKSSATKQFVIHNPVSEQHVEMCRKQGKDNFEKNLVFGVFNDYPHKDAPTFFRAIAMLRGEQPEKQWRAVILGDGQWQSHYTNLLSELDLTGHIDFLGYIPADRIADYYSQAFCMMNTSRLEAFNNTPLEAMSLGCPVVISNCCSHPEVVGDAGILVEPGNAQKFAEAIMSLKQDRAFYSQLRERGFQRVQHFMPEDSGKKFLEIFNDITKTQTI